MTYRTVDDDVSDVMKAQEAEKVRRHELEMRDHEEKMAKIEAKRAKTLAREERRKEKADEYLVARVIIVIILCIFLLLGGCMARNSMPAKIKKDQEQYELCMKYEKDDAVCTNW